MKRNILSVVALAILMTLNSQAADTKVIAHRGYWNTEGSAQNSVRSIVKADSIHAYGSEFDVWLTADKKLVVNHDAAINGIEIETSKSKDVLAQKLRNGENVSTLGTYLNTAKKLKINLILELKPHKDKVHEAEAVKKILAMVKKKGLQDRIEYITFSLPGLKELIRLAPKGTPIYYLNGELTPKELKELGASGQDYHLSAFKKHPEWIKESHDLGMKVNAWTVNKKEDMQWCIDNKVDFITTNEPTMLQAILK